MGNDLKQKILIQNGIVLPEELKGKPSVLNCARCGLVNTIENKYCSRCSYPLSVAAFEEIKLEEHKKMVALQEIYDEKLKTSQDNILRDVELKFNQILEKIDLNKLNNNNSNC